MIKQRHITPRFANARKHVTLTDTRTGTVHEFELELEQHPTWMWVEHIAFHTYGLRRGQWSMTVRGLIDGELVSNLELIPFTNELRDSGVVPIQPEGFTREQ